MIHTRIRLEKAVYNSGFAGWERYFVGEKGQLIDLDDAEPINERVSVVYAGMAESEEETIFVELRKQLPIPSILNRNPTPNWDMRVISMCGSEHSIHRDFWTSALYASVRSHFIYSRGVPDVERDITERLLMDNLTLESTGSALQ